VLSKHKACRKVAVFPFPSETKCDPDGFAHWLAGLTDGDGSFTFRQNNQGSIKKGKKTFFTLETFVSKGKKTFFYFVLGGVYPPPKQRIFLLRLHNLTITVNCWLL